MTRARRCPPHAVAALPPVLRRLPALPIVVLLLLAACGPAPPSRPPDIVLISLDSVRADDLTFLDERAAPALTALARRGTIFTHAIAGSSWTLPSHVEMFAGCPPALHGVMLDHVAMDPLQPTLPELLGAAGYHTAGLFSGDYLDPRYGFGRGFDSYEDCAILPDEAAGRDAGAGAGGGADKTAGRHASAVSGPRLAERAEAVVAAAPKDKPLFLFAHFFDPHYDYLPPWPYDTLFDPDYAGDLDPHGFWTNTRIFDATKTPPRQVSDRDLAHLRALYRGEIAWTDSNVGRLLAALDKADRLAGAVIIVTSDHGEEFFEHGNRGHRSTLFDEVLRVPLLVVPPADGAGIAAGAAGAGGRPAAGGLPRAAGCAASVDDQVSLSDLAPTLLDFAGAAVPPSMSGTSLRGAVFGEDLPARPVYSTLCLATIESGRKGLWLYESLRWPGSKLLLSYRFEEATGLVLRDANLHDFARDPGETAPPPFVAGDLQFRRQFEVLESAMGPLRARYAAVRHTPDDARTVSRSPGAEENLRALGYVGGPPRAADGSEVRLPWGLAPRPKMVTPR